MGENGPATGGGDTLCLPFFGRGPLKRTSIVVDSTCIRKDDSNEKILKNSSSGKQIDSQRLCRHGHGQTIGLSVDILIDDHLYPVRETKSGIFEAHSNQFSTLDVQLSRRKSLHIVTCRSWSVYGLFSGGVCGGIPLPLW